MFSSRETHLVVLRELDVVRTALREALAAAGPDEQRGLERALSVLDGLSGNEQQLKAKWVVGLLQHAGIDPRTEEMSAVRELRRAIPGLGLAAAVDLVKQANAAV
ncbi:hypothetical protein F7Q99_11925 [Streptomyces kaniharaensis]|uniref:Uncharacterized protein n=1 Tax=Streptomyces kaniharaensis TaxID=212423 RepID=A0A6N7KN73_9ACTN|nr:hypothetical protein [Streptomyces kaniharaensis]MQS12980.1 hypothetical protein [Streptomyces kaniharaensis]